MYQGYLIKVNGKIFPNSMIRADTYTITPDQIVDLDSYTDNDGELHRNPLSHTSTKIEFNTPTMYEYQIGIVRSILPLSNPHEKSVVDVEYYNPSSMEYQNMKAYVPDISYSLYYADSVDVIYNETRLAFIEY